MLMRLDQKFLLDPIIKQVTSLNFEKRLAVNETSGNLLSGEYHLLPEFKNTPLGNVIDQINDPGEARLIKLSSGEGYTAHTDPDDRYHLAITTNPFCFFIDINQKEMSHIPADGQLWYMDTSPVHVAVNYGGTDRIHLVVRKRLPKFVKPGYRLRFSHSAADWKQQVYINLMAYLNTAIKQGQVTGMEKVNDYEMLLSVRDQSTLDNVSKLITDSGAELDIKRET